MRWNAKDLTNKRFGRLVAIEPTDKRLHRCVIWKCKCDCGKEHYVVTFNLTMGRIRSCGCLKRDMHSLPEGEAAFNRLFSGYKQKSRIKDYDFNLTKKQFKKLTKSNCFYCGEPPSNKYAINTKDCNGFYLGNGIDRVDNEKGYTLENSVPCCKICNHAKATLSSEEFLDRVKQIYNHSIKESK